MIVKKFLLRALSGASLSTLIGGPLVAYAVTIDGGQVVTVPGSQASPWDTGGLTVGDTGNGTLEVTSGGSVSATGSFIIGYETGSTGSVLVDGEGSEIRAPTVNTVIGRSGNATLSITNGGLFTSNTGWIGGYNDGTGTETTGTVSIDGPGSQWINGIGSIVLGTFGNGTVNVTNGGVVSSAANSTVGYRFGGTGYALVSGSGSQWNTSNDFYVGRYNDSSGVLDILDGGYVSNVQGNIGYVAASTGSVTVSGPGSQWANATQLYVGNSGNGSLSITNGGAVSDVASYIANETGSTGAVTVSGPGSLWTNTYQLVVGNYGNGSLAISDGGTVSNTNGYIGLLPGGTGAVTVSGSGSRWTNTGDLYIGTSGVGAFSPYNGELAITDKGVVSSTNGYIGYNNYGIGSVTVSGPGSQWTNASNLYVGNYGSGTLSITDGGVVSDMGGYIGNSTNGTGLATVSGSGSQWSNTGQLTVGNAGYGVLAITDGGKVSNTDSSIGALTGSTGSVTVSGPGSQWTNIGTLTVGNAGSGTLVAADGGQVSAEQVVGNGSLLLNGGVLQALATNSDFIDVDGTFELQPDGGTIDSNGFDIGTSSILSGSGSLTKTGMGTLTLNSASTYTGDTLVNQGTLAVTATGNIAPSHVFVAPAGTLAGEGVVGGTVNAGIVAPGLSSMGTLTVVGNYTGNTGLLHIETQLGDDDSPTDHLVISGNADGNTAVKVTNLGGLGAQTVNGINIIKVGGLAEDNTFLLSGDYVTADGQQAVIGGAYAYTLHANGNAATAGRDWYLSSALSNPPEPLEPQEPQEPEGSSSPRYQAGVPLYEQYPQVLASLNTLPTLQQRVGNRYWSPGVLSALDSGGSDEGQWAWGRIEGRHQVTDPASSTSSSNRDIDVWKLQTGIDVPLHQGQDGSLLTGGVNFTYGKANADISSYFGYGSIDTSAYGLGATLTWYGNDGVYVDGQLQTLWFDSDLYSNTEGQSVANGNNGRGYATSLETGKRYSLGNGLSLTPQIQLTYSRVDFDSFSDPYGTQVSLEDGDSLRARAGVSLDKEIAWIANDGTTSRSHFYTNLDLYNEFLNGTKTRVSGVDFTTRDERQSVGIGAGATQEWQNGRYAVYGNINLLTATRNVDDNYAVGGTVGLRISW